MKFAEIFKSVNTPYQCIITEINPKTVTKYGDKALVKMSCGGQDYEWWASLQTFAQSITANGINVSDVVEIMQVPSTGKFPTYTFKKLSSGEATAAGITPAKVATAVSDTNKKADLKDNKILIQGLLQALVNSGKYGIEECKKITMELAEFVKAQAEDMYKAENDPNHVGNSL